ncbi:MAG: hypothetical protein ABW184_03575 [Sphingobium sp.]
MVSRIELVIDVTDRLALGERASVAATIILPDPSDLPERPIICFAKMGGGYSRGYYTNELPGPGSGAQAGWHAQRGWIFVAMDHIGTGGSSRHAAERLSYQLVTAAAVAAEEDILLRLANGIVAAGFPPIHQPVRIGIGQSMGGGLTIVQQGRHHCYDGIATLGFSAVHSHPPRAPGGAPIYVPWVPRDGLFEQPATVINQAALRRGIANETSDDVWQALAWGFFYDDVPQEVVEANLTHLDQITLRTDPEPTEDPADWRSFSTLAQVTQASMTPGAVAPEAAAVTVPVLCAMGERDIVPDPRGEPRAFKSSGSVDIFICPRMGHMHNFASTRALFWQRIEAFGEMCAAVKAAG